MSTCRLVRKHGNQGQAAVEALLVLMVLASVIFGGIELSRGVTIRQALDSSTGAATRALSLDPTQWGYSTFMIQQAMDQNVMGSSSEIGLKVFDAAGTARSSGWLANSSFGTSFILETSAPFQADIPFLPTGVIIIRVRHWGIVERYP